MNKHKVLISGLVLALILGLFGGVILTVNAALPPTVKVVSVFPHSMVQLEVTNMPANVKFAVTMGAAGSQGVGPVVAHVYSTAGGTQRFWVEILADVLANATVDVRIDNGKGQVAWTSFNNTSTLTAPAPTAVPTAVVGATPALGTGGALTTGMKILHVQQGGWVSAEMRNLPVSSIFSVSVSKGGSGCIGGQIVAHVKTTSSGPAILAGTFEIPVTINTSATLDLCLQGGGVTLIKTFSNVNQ